jgi:hypothetical protein
MIDDYATEAEATGGGEGYPPTVKRNYAIITLRYGEVEPAFEALFYLGYNHVTLGEALGVSTVSIGKWVSGGIRLPKRRYAQLVALITITAEAIEKKRNELGTTTEARARYNELLRGAISRTKDLVAAPRYNVAESYRNAAKAELEAYVTLTIDY